MFQPFMTDEHTRKRYWARSLIGWRFFRRAKPNRAHLALAQLEREGRIELLVTQNVDCLHEAAGSSNVVDLAWPARRRAMHDVRATLPA